MNVLLAEDNPVNQEITSAYLETLGCAITVVENGKEAVAAAIDGTFDLVLMDCQMPVMSGMDAARAIREASIDGKKVPIVAFTAIALENTRAECLAAGMDDFLVKPFSRKDLLMLLQRWCPALGLSPTTESGDVPESPTWSPDTAPIAALHTRDHDGDCELVQRLIKRFIDISDGLITHLADAAARGDVDDVSRIARILKSCSANLGAIVLSTQSAAIERLAADGNLPADMDERLAALQATREAAKRGFLLLIEGA